MLLWNVPAPNEALLISGSKHREQDMQFRIVTGHGSFVLPIKQGENQALIAANKLVDLLPSLVEASAKGIAGSNLTVLNGTEGVNQVAAGVVAQGLSIYESLRRSVAHGPSTDGAGSRDAPGEPALEHRSNQPRGSAATSPRRGS